MAGLAAGQRRILALLEELASKHAAAATGDAGTDLDEAARSIAAATEWASDIRAAMDSLLVTAGKSIRDLEKAEQGLGIEAAVLKTRAEGIDGQIEALGSGARTLGTRLKELDQARQKLDARSAELQAVKQEIAKYYREWTAGAVTYRQEMATLSKRLGEGENLVARVEKAVGPWTARIEKSLDENAKAQDAGRGPDLRQCAGVDRERQRLPGDVRHGLGGGAGGLQDRVAAHAALVGAGSGGGADPDGAGPARHRSARPEPVGRLRAPTTTRATGSRSSGTRHGAKVKKCVAEDALDSKEPVHCSFEARWN